MAEQERNEELIAAHSELYARAEEALGKDGMELFTRLSRWLAVSEAVGAVGDLGHLFQGYALSIRDGEEVAYRVAAMNAPDLLQMTHDYVEGKR